MSSFVCWWCGAEAVDVETVTTLDDRERLLVVAWSQPAGDHVHTVKPPTAGELASAGHAAFLRVIGAAV